MLFRKTFGLRRPRRLRVRAGLVGSRLPDAFMRPRVREPGRVRRAGHVRVQVRLVRRELYHSGLCYYLRQRRELHGTGHVHLPLAMEWRRLQSTRL